MARGSSLDSRGTPDDRGSNARNQTVFQHPLREAPDRNRSRRSDGRIDSSQRKTQEGLLAQPSHGHIPTQITIGSMRGKLEVL
jgi:hypothetical protein